MTNTYKGFHLFNDIEDDVLRNRNRAVVLTNLADDHTEHRKINYKGASLILGYFKVIPEQDKEAVKKLFQETMERKGYILARS